MSVFLIDRFCQNGEWFVDTVSNLFFAAGELVDSEVSESVMHLIAQGINERRKKIDFDEEEGLAQYALKSYLQMIDSQRNIPINFVKVIAWVKYLFKISIEISI